MQSFLILLALILAAPSAQALEKSMVSGKAKDAKPFVQQAHSKVTKLPGYSFHSTLKTYKGKRTKRNEGDLFFKKRHAVRFVVTGKGFKSGSIVVKQDNGLIRAKGSGLMGAMVLNLQENSRMLRTPNGFVVTKCDFASLLAQIKRKLQSSYSGKVTSGPINVNGRKLHVLELYPKGKSILSERIFFTPSLIPTKWDIYRNGRLFSTFIISRYSPRIPNSSLFSL